MPAGTLFECQVSSYYVLITNIIDIVRFPERNGYLLKTL